MDKAMNDFLITKTFITETVLNSIENSIWKSFRASMYDTLFNTTGYAVRFNALRNLTIAALTDRSSRAIVGSVFAASENATRDYFET
jgi:hypothetical protein